jgi:outer membrane protein TolC
MKRSLIILLLLIPVIAGAQVYSLRQCIDMALENSRELKNSRIDQQMAEQTRKELFTKYFPSVSAGGATFRSNEYLIRGNMDLSFLAPMLGALGVNPATMGIPLVMPLELIREGTIGLVTATQPVFTGGQIYYGNKLAKVGSDVSAMKITLSEKEIIIKTEEYFWQIVSLKEKLRTISAGITQLNELYKSVDAAVTAGLTTRNDLLRIDLEQQNNESSKIKIENNIKIFKILLCNITGASPEAFEVDMPELPDIQSPLGYYINTADGVSARTENQLLSKNVEAAELQRKLAIGKNLPAIAAGAGYLYHNLMEKDEYPGMIFATVSIPISSWWGGSYGIKRSRLGEIKAENDRLSMQQNMAVDIELKWNNLQESYLQTEIAKKSIESASENLRISKDYYDAGTIPLSDLLNARTQLQKSQDQYTEACTTYYLKLSAYLKATGR